MYIYIYICIYTRTYIYIYIYIYIHKLHSSRPPSGAADSRQPRPADDPEEPLPQARHGPWRTTLRACDRLALHASAYVNAL